MLKNPPTGSGRPQHEGEARPRVDFIAIRMILPAKAIGPGRKHAIAAALPVHLQQGHPHPVPVKKSGKVVPNIIGTTAKTRTHSAPELGICTVKTDKAFDIALARGFKPGLDQAADCGFLIVHISLNLSACAKH